MSIEQQNKVDINQDPDFIKKPKLPEVDRLLVWLIIFNFPITIWPLLVMLVTAINPLSEAQGNFAAIMTAFVWLYPLVFIIITYGLYRLAKNNRERGVRIVKYATLVEFLLFMTFLVYTTVGF